MKRLITALTLLFMGTTMVLSAQSVAAVDVLQPSCEGVTDSTLCDDNKPQTLRDNGIFGQDGILRKATSLVLILVGIASVIMIIIGGFKYVISNGDSNAINSAKNTILYAVIGLIVALLAQAILVFVIGKL